MSCALLSFGGGRDRPRCQNGPSDQASLFLAFLLVLFLAVGCDSGGSDPEPPSSPSAPTGLRAQPDGQAIALEWSAASGSDVQYNIYRSTGPIESVSGREPINEDPVGQVSFTDQEARAWEPHRYRVTALRTSGGETTESDPSGEVQMTLPETEYVLEAPDPQGPVGFGVPLNLAGDVDRDGTVDFVVGTFTLEGTVPKRTYLVSGADGTLLRRLRPEGLSPEDAFGWGGNGVGDIDGDGTPDVLVGTPRADVNGIEESGRAHMLSGADGSVLWSRSSPEPQEGGQFGSGAPFRDVTGDGKTDVLVTATGESAGGLQEAGRIYLLDGSDGSVLDTLVSPDPQQGARFGFPTSAEGADLNGDGIRDLVVRVRRRDVGGTEDAGRVYVIDGGSLGDESDPEVIRTVESPNPESGGSFGAQGDVLDDVDGDGTLDLLIGAPAETPGEKAQAGRAYLISGADGSVIRTFSSPWPESEGLFGIMLEAEDVNQDGTPDLAVRSLETAGGFSRAGRIYLLDGASLLDGNPPREAILRQFASPNPEANGFLGTDFEILPEENLLVAGANGEASGGVQDAGRIYAFPLP